jgi:glycosyltransferase involved in cell wall biosynthesis
MKTKLSFVPHGINKNIFRPITEGDIDYEEFKKIETDFKNKHGVKFIIFWNNRNIRRKQPGDVILAFKKFCDMLPKENRKEVCLLMKTQVVDENGTDLWAVKKNICPNYKVLFEDSIIIPKVMNFFYNLADVTINIASNEGFGLSNAESIMAGTVTVTNVTGGLQDQCRFEDEHGKWIKVTPQFPTNHKGKYKVCGKWVKPIFPSSISLQGSPYTPYIFDDRVDADDVAKAIFEWYDTDKQDRINAGLTGREWLCSEESGLSSFEMCRRMKRDISNLLNEWKAPDAISIFEVKPKQYNEEIGIV